jgi:signal transduction histidine kinase
VGLALVRQVAERYGGDCGVAPADGGGAAFTVRLPVPS